MHYKDYYQILGLSRDATQDQVKQAYRRLARKYHPDVSKEKEAETRFKDIGEAYEVLKDPEKRTAYDRFGANWREGQDVKPPPHWEQDFSFQGAGYTGGNEAEFSDFFEYLFGHGGVGGTGRMHGHASGRTTGQQSFRAKGNDQHATISITLAEAHAGGDRSISLAQPVMDEQGQISIQPRILHVTLPKGLIAGQKIRLEGQGEPGYGGAASGDLFLEISLQEDPLFRVQKRDVHLELPVTPWEAALGATLMVPTLDGKVQVKIPPGSQGGKKLRLKGKGLCSSKHSGDQIVTLRIVLPEATNEEQRRVYTVMAEKMPFNPRAALGV